MLLYKKKKIIAGKWIQLDTIIPDEKNSHVWTHLHMNNNHKLQEIHTTFLDPEEDKQEGRLRCSIDVSAAKSTDCPGINPEIQSQHPHGGS